MGSTVPSILALFAGLLAGACAVPETSVERAAGAPIDEACAPTDPRGVELTVVAQPEAGTEGLVELVRGAEESIDLAVYMLGDDTDVFDALVERAGEIDVRVMVDERATARRVRTALEDAGALAQTQPDAFAYVRYGPYYHPKLAVFDRQRAWISTGNLREPYMSTERNYDVTDDDPEDVADLAEIFDADWEGRAPDLDCTRLVVSPENARERLLAFIDGAESTLVVESMQLADRQVRAHVVARAEAGVEVRIVLADGCWIAANVGAAALLADAGIAARWMSEFSAHVKMMVADGARAYLGSVNMSRTSIDRNREVGLILDDAPALEVLHTTFEHDWSAAVEDWTVFPDLCR